MRHGLQLYFPGGMSELADFGGAGGLDKIWRFAPGMVQSGYASDATPAAADRALWGNFPNRDEKIGVSSVPVFSEWPVIRPPAGDPCHRIPLLC